MAIPGTTIASEAVHAIGMRLGQFFLAPGSAFSLASLAVTLAVFVVATTYRRHRRTVSLRLLRRVLLPRRLLGTASGRTVAAFALAAPTLTFFALGWALVSAEAVRGAVAAYFDGDLTALDGLAVKTGGTVAGRTTRRSFCQWP